MGNVTPNNVQDYIPVMKYNSGTDNVLLTDGSGNALFAHGTTVPSDAATGYATGCLYCHTDGTDGTALYVNEGSSTSADFNAITVA